MKNTLLLYARQVLILGTSLYTVRVVLQELGVVDYGIYNVVAGVVALLSFMKAAMASATQRFFSFGIGEDNQAKLRSLFTVNCGVYGGIAAISFVLLETVGLWFVRQHLNIPSERMGTAAFVYQLSIFTFIATILSSPFMAIIIAHEDMDAYAFISIAEAVLKLTTAFALTYTAWDKLALYGWILLLISLVTLALFSGYCFKKYEEAKFTPGTWDSALLREVISFTGWTFFGQISTVARGQAVTILLNQFFNPATVAARAIAINVASQVNVFANNFNLGLYPPIIKAYAANKQEEMYAMIIMGSRLSFFLLWIFALPMILGMEIVLQIWLGSAPEGAVLFARLALVEAVLLSASLPLATAARAPGDMRKYELILGSVQVAIFAASWGVLKLGFEAYSVFVVAVVANCVMFFQRLWLVKGLIGLSPRRFLSKAGIPILQVGVVSCLAAGLSIYWLPKSVFGEVASLALPILTTGLVIYSLGLQPSERAKLAGIIRKRIGKVLPS